MFKKILLIVVFPVLLLITSACAPANSYGYDEEQADGGNSPEQEVIAEEETWYAIPAGCEDEPVPADKTLILYYDWCTLEEPQGIEYFELTDHAVYVDDVEVPILAQDLGEAYFNEEEECFSQGYWMEIGYLDPGYHIIVTNATPREQVFDGLDWFGPGTEYEHLDFWCNVIVGDENVQVAAQVEDEGGSVEEELTSEETAPVEEEEHICNRSKYVRETIPDHTVFAPGQTFEKTWTVRNEGECTWNTGYTFDHTQGATLGGQTSQNLVQDVAPGEEITLKVNLKAPDAPGTYTGRWEIFADNGEALGWYSVVIDVVEEVDVIEQNKIHSIYYKNNSTIKLIYFGIKELNSGQATVLDPGKIQEFMNWDREKGISPGKYTIHYEWWLQPDVYFHDTIIEINTDGQIINLPP